MKNIEICNDNNTNDYMININHLIHLLILKMKNFITRYK